MQAPLVIIDDLNIKRRAAVKTEADAPLVVDADTPLPIAVAVQRLQPIAGRDTQPA